MNKYKEHLVSFLQELELELPENLVERLEQFSYILREVNQKVNVVSRKMPIEWYWTNHFLDSLLILKCMTFSGLTVLDFGTGGGLPGIPLKLAVPDMKVVLLDATHKKILMVEEIVEEMKLEDCEPVCMRVEDFAAITRRPSFDVVLCRAVSMEPRYVLPPGAVPSKNHPSFPECLCQNSRRLPPKARRERHHPGRQGLSPDPHKSIQKATGPPGHRR